VLPFAVFMALLNLSSVGICVPWFEFSAARGLIVLRGGVRLWGDRVGPDE
jgi:hypothetical protein